MTAFKTRVVVSCDSLYLESLTVVALHVERPRQLIARFGTHGLVLGVVEGVEGQMLDPLVVLLKEEVIGQMIEDHGVRRVDRVGFGELFHALLKVGKVTWLEKLS